MSSETNPRNAFENAVFALGLLLVGALITALTVEALGRPAGGPQLEVQAGAPVDGMAPVTVRNTGGRVAEAVRVEVCRGEACGEVEIPYVPAGAEREASVGVEGADSLDARIVSFLAP